MITIFAIVVQVFHDYRFSCIQFVVISIDCIWFAMLKLKMEIRGLID